MTRKLNGAQHDLFPEDAALSGPTIHRSRHQGNYTVIANATLNDPSLSLDTKGLLCWLLSKSDNWRHLGSHRKVL